MIKYYLINNERLVKGEASETSAKLGFVDTAFEYQQGVWQEISRNEVNDRVIGYDPYEDFSHALGNTDIMNEIKKISEDEAERIIEKWQCSQTDNMD